MNFERVERISDKINPKLYETKQELIAAILLETANDFPKFRTAAKPNEWEQGYHCVLETMHDISNEMKQYVKKLNHDHEYGYEWTPLSK
jgi:hypothetical protein